MAANYTFEDVQKLINDNNLYFSDADLNLARNNPNAGMTIGNYKIDYANATTDDQRALANAGAEQTRKDYGNYTGGVDGSKYYMYEPTPMSYYNADFKNPYQEEWDAAKSAVLNREEFSYDPNTDPLFQSARQMYLREADRAQNNAMGQAAAMTGGIPSTAAMTAASQAGDYYRSQLNDSLPTFAEMAYQKHIDNIGLDFDTFAMLNDLRGAARNEYDTDRNFGYNQWTDELAFRTDEANTKYEREWNEEARDYEREWNEESRDYEREWNEEARDYEREQYKTEYGDALSLDVLANLQAEYEKTKNADLKKRIDAILAGLYENIGLK